MPFTKVSISGPLSKIFLKTAKRLTVMQQQFRAMHALFHAFIVQYNEFNQFSLVY